MPVGGGPLLHRILQVRAPFILWCLLQHAVSKVIAKGGSKNGESRGEILWVIQEVLMHHFHPLSIGQNWITRSNPTSTKYGTMSLSVCLRGIWNCFVEQRTQWWYLFGFIGWHQWRLHCLIALVGDLVLLWCMDPLLSWPRLLLPRWCVISQCVGRWPRWRLSLRIVRDGNDLIKEL